MSWLSSIGASTVLAAAAGAFSANLISEWVKSLVRKGQLAEQNRDEDLAAILQTVQALQELSETYWMGSAVGLAGQEPLLAAHIVAKQQSVLSLIASILSASTGKYEADAAFTDVMAAMTGGDFGEPDREADPRRLVEILNKSLAFSLQIKRSRRALKRSFLA